MINSRKLEDLNPKVKPLVEAFIAKCHEEGIDVLITSTYRDAESQNALYAQGRTTPGNKVTNAKAGQSFHNWKCAADFTPLVNGKPDWNNTSLFDKCGEIAEKCGLEWAGRWKKFPEKAHVQFTGGLSLADFQAGKTL
jgi:peptidoglycan L-alanyl-D-glutamate endopeptidase CwlK